MASDFDARQSGVPALRFMAVLKAAADFGLDQETLNAVAVRFDPREPDLDGVVDALAAALLRAQTMALPDAV